MSAAARPRGLAANVIAQLTLGLLAMTLCLPSLQEWPAIFGASQASVQLTFSGFVAAYGGMQLVFGPWSDRIGRRPVLVFGVALAGAGALAAAFSNDLWLLVAARVLQGAGCAASMVVGRALVQDFYAGSERVRVLGLVGMTMGFVPPTATLVGGAVHVAWGWRANFVLLAAIAAVLLLAAWRGLPAKADVQPAGPGWLRELARGYARLARTRGFVPHVLLLTCTAATFFAFLGGAPIVLAGYGVTPDRLGWYVMAPTLSYVVGNLATTRLIRVRSERELMLLGQFATMAGIALVLVLGFTGPRSPLSFALPLVLLGFGHGLLVAPTLAGTVGVVPALAGSAAAVAGVLQQFGGALGGYVAGLVPRDGQVPLAAMMLGWAAFGLAALLHLRRKPRP